MTKKLATVGALLVLALVATACDMKSTDSANPTSVRPTTAKVDGGEIMGVRADDVTSFKGVPYAAPPVGNLRWHAPEPVVAWKGVREATKLANDCLQKPNPGDAAPLGGPMGEDCLYLNVWTPDTPRPTAVLVSIHGGGYVNGGTTPPLYDGAAMAKQGVVVVTVNYRLGRFGFFAHPALTAAKEGPTGNFGYMDQIAALKWVQRNIAQFGGDPKNVTIIGESAGGESILHLLADPAARGLFNKAICLSGGGRKPLLDQRELSVSTLQLPSAEQIGLNFAKENGIEGSGADALAKLRVLPAENLVGDLNMDRLHSIPKIMTYVKGPIADGVNIEETIKAGNAANVPLIIGSTSIDVGDKPPANAPFSIFGVNADKAKSIYTYTPPGSSSKISTNHILDMIAADRTMNEPARFVAREMTAQGNPVWLYRFSYIAESLRPNTPGAYHASELPYIWGTLNVRYGKDATNADREASRQWSGYLVNFIKTGNPNGSLPAWPKFDPAKDQLMNITNAGPQVQPDPFKARLDLVETIQGK